MKKPTSEVAANQDSPSRGALRRQKAAAKKRAAAEAEEARAAKAAKANAKGAKGKGKGGGGGKVAIGQGPNPGANLPPPGCLSHTPGGQQIGYAFNKGRCTRGDKCKYAHVSWNPPAGAASAGSVTPS